MARLSRAEAKARTRELLLDAAARVFAQKGYAGASVDEIAEAAGYSIGAVYSNFGGKEQLFVELLKERANDRVTQAAEILADAEPGEAHRAMSRLVIDVADKDTDFAPLQAEFWLYAVRNPQLMETLAERMREPRDMLTALVGRSVPGAAKADQLSTIIMALFQGLVRQRRTDPDSVPEELFGQALEWLFTGAEADEEQP
ncbi:TetR/AcrR family transcriptional regulator [Kutzneria sp. CA-103260]|uniref:TetR/AcrR family transcriptional regulator n=1 Tax=Kutzneria sp. CA-103260 TaxID=2802641 RepID=UPI001BEE87FF|nr:TetR/AcrR family transcriptional regulator [Kutzneria sp. CA-103260]QUQ62907.1 TetR family transcriptional regulator [Kutzneria sp. CA-103260]